MLKIGIAQIDNYFEVDKNLTAIQRALRALAERGADLVLFPECAVSGYNTSLLKPDMIKIADAVKDIQRLAEELKIYVALPTPWPTSNEGIYNSVLIISDEGKFVQTLHKIGLQRGEEKMFKAAMPHKRVFEVKGVKVGVIICVETSLEPWAYLQKSDGAELIFWPGFYAANADELNVEMKNSKSTSDQKVMDNLINHWQVPLILVNGSSSPEAHYWPGKVFGGSSVFNRNGERVFLAKRAEEDLSVLQFRDFKLTL